MTTLPATGSANWHDYIDYWREADAEWLQSRLVLRYASPAERDADPVSAPSTVGRLVYITDVGGGVSQLQLRGSAGWTKFDALPANMAITVDSPTQVSMSHIASSSKGITYREKEVSFNNIFKVVPGGGTLTAPAVPGIFTVDDTGVMIKIGAKVAKLTTDADNLVSDTPISAPGGTLTGGLTGTTANFSGNITANGATLASATVTGTVTAAARGHSIGGVSFPATPLTTGAVPLPVTPAAYVKADGGHVSDTGIFYGAGANGAVIRQRDSATGAMGASFFNVAAAEFKFNNGDCFMNAQLRIQGNRSIIWHDTGKTLGPNIWQAGDPGAANYPDGTLWLEP